MSKVLAIAVHPDDETLGCAGALLRHRAEGDDIYWMIVTSVKENKDFSAKDLRQKELQIESVGKKYGFKKVYRLNFPTTELDQVPMKELIDKITGVFKELKPEIIYLPFHADVHSDHRKFFEAALSCTKVFRFPFIRKLLMMETLSETEFAAAMGSDVFIPNYFVDITPYFDKKIEIMRLYDTEIKPAPFPRSMENIKALAVYRGSTAGCTYAESFMLLKEIVH
jgi:LmbE family N-acetylglucosaminyl deacetylase